MWTRELVKREGNNISFNDGQLLKQSSWIYVTLDGIVILFNDEQFEKHSFESDRIVVGRIIVESDEHSLKHFSPIDVTLDGIVISCNEWQEKKHFSGSKMMFAESWTFDIFLHW